MAIDDIKTAAFDARSLYKSGLITREDAKESIMPYIVAYNAKSTEIARKYGMRPKKISFAGFLR